MEQIRVRKGIEIGVNDNGDSINVDVEDIAWVKRYRELVKRIEGVSNRLNLMKTDGMDEDAQFDVVFDSMNEVTDAIDTMFGENTCKKVFGDIVPSPMAVIEFFEQLNPIVEKYTAERNEKITAKYNANRKGGKK